MKLILSFFKISKIILYFLLIYIIIFISIYIISAFALKKSTVLNIPIFRDFQINFYDRIGNRVIWQTQKECVQYDEDLIYVPRINFECKFNEVEFKTNLNFDEYGRKTKFKENFIKKQANLRNIQIEGKDDGIVVLGDSFAMGYGVNDEEVFSALLEKKINRPVYNLAVSSYATEREILRLKKSKLIDKVDTILIFYADNDIGENRASNANQKKENNKLIFDKIINDKTSSLIKIRKIVRYSLQIPIHELTNKTSYFDWNDHEKELINVIRKYPFIHKKKIFIIVFPGSLERRSYYKNYEPKEYPEFNYLKFLYIQNKHEDYFLIDGHPNQKGHEKVSEILYNKIKTSR
jgi:hypothetical protein